MPLASTATSCGVTGRAGEGALQAVDDDVLARLDAVDDAHGADQRAGLDFARLDQLVGADHQHDLAGLVGGDGAVRHHGRLVRLAGADLDARRQARREAAVLVVEDGAQLHAAGGRVEAVVDEIDLAGVRKALLVEQAHLHRGRRFRVACRLAVFEEGGLAGVEVGVHAVGRDDGGEHRLADADQVAGGDVGARHAAADRRGDPGIAEVQARGLERGLGGVEAAAGVLRGGAQLVGFLLGNGAHRQQLVGARDFALGKAGLGAGRFDAGGGARHFGGEWARVDGKQQRALAHDLAVAEMDALERAGDARAHVDLVDRGQARAEFVEFFYRAARYRRHRYRRRAAGAGRLRLRRPRAAASEERRQQRPASTAIRDASTERSFGSSGVDKRDAMAARASMPAKLAADASLLLESAIGAVDCDASLRVGSIGANDDLVCRDRHLRSVMQLFVRFVWVAQFARGERTSL